LIGADFVHTADLKEEEAYRSGDPYRVALVEIGGARTMLVVPLRKDGALLGQIAIYRQEVRPYSEKQTGAHGNERDAPIPDPPTGARNEEV
jgi:hypothetical protein